MLSIWILTSLITFVLAITETLLSLRIILKLLGASSAAPFVHWIYETTNSLITPFKGMFPHPILDGGFVLEFSTLFALVFYATVGYVLTEALQFISLGLDRFRKIKQRKEEQ